MSLFDWVWMGAALVLPAVLIALAGYAAALLAWRRYV